MSSPRTAGVIAAAVALATAACSGSGGRSGAPSTSIPTTSISTTSAPPASTSTSTAPTTTPPPATSTTGPGCTDASVIRSWSVARRAAQLVVVPVIDANPVSVAVAVQAHAGGVLLLGAIPSGPQLVAALHAALADPETPRPFVMVDQEGGGVQRLGADVTSMPWPRQMAATLSTSQVHALAEQVGRQMAALGVGVDLAPVLDLDGGPTLSASDPDGPRSFSTDPAVAARYGLAFATGLAAGGVLAVAKHFPGLGQSTGNTDYGPAATRPLSELESAGILPFQQAAAGGVRAIMVANATVPGLTSKPASVSPAVVTGLLRSRLHFTGLVMTDSLSAKAITEAGYTIESAAVAAVEAGSDMILFGSTLTPADTAQNQANPLAVRTQSIIDAFVRAVATGALPQSRLNEAVLHVVQAKGARLC